MSPGRSIHPHAQLSSSNTTPPVHSTSARVNAITQLTLLLLLWVVMATHQAPASLSDVTVT